MTTQTTLETMGIQRLEAPNSPYREDAMTSVEPGGLAIIALSTLPAPMSSISEEVSRSWSPPAISADRDIDWVSSARKAMVRICGTTDSTKVVSTWLRDRSFEQAKRAAGFHRDVKQPAMIDQVLLRVAFQKGHAGKKAMTSPREATGSAQARRMLVTASSKTIAPARNRVSLACFRARLRLQTRPWIPVASTAMPTPASSNSQPMPAMNPQITGYGINSSTRARR